MSRGVPPLLLGTQNEDNPKGRLVLSSVCSPTRKTGGNSTQPRQGQHKGKEEPQERVRLLSAKVVRHEQSYSSPRHTRHSRLRVLCQMQVVTARTHTLLSALSLCVLSHSLCSRSTVSASLFIHMPLSQLKQHPQTGTKSIVALALMCHRTRYRS